MSCKVFLFLSSGGRFCSVERNHFSNFGRGSPKEYFCEYIFNRAIGLGEDVI